MKNQGLGCAFPINALSIRWNASSKLLVLLVSVDTQNRAGPIRSNQKDSMYWMKRCSIICWAISRGSIALIQTSRNACIGKERLEKQHSFKEGAGDNILQVRPKQCQEEEEQAQLPFWWLFELLHFPDITVAVQYDTRTCILTEETKSLKIKANNGLVTQKEIVTVLPLSFNQNSKSKLRSRPAREKRLLAEMDKKRLTRLDTGQQKIWAKI